MPSKQTVIGSNPIAITSKYKVSEDLIFWDFFICPQFAFKYWFDIDYITLVCR